MQKNNRASYLRLLVVAALLASISIVMGKYLAFGVGNVLRFSFENMPIIFAGIAFGPLVGTMVGVVADLVGCILVGYEINILVTVGAALIGLISGLAHYLPCGKNRFENIMRIVLAVFFSHLIGSVVVKTIGLSAYYDMNFGILILWRLLNYAIIGVLEAIIIYQLMKNKMIQREIESIRDEKRKVEGAMTYEQALEYIHGVSWTFCKPGLERISELCEKLGNPQNSLKFIHVAGTNGKGSFCSMTDSVLRSAGYKVGLYTSPYITAFNERMRVNGENIPNETLARITERVRPIADGMKDKPTEFELITAIAFEYFKEEKCEIVVLEAGMGGRLDSTNIIRNPLLSVITGIALDHTAFLGDTVEKIAVEKAGIIKDGAPVLFGGDDVPRVVISEIARERRSDFFTPDYHMIQNLVADLSGSTFIYKNYKDVKINLLGLYQSRNAALVIEAVEILRSRGIEISDDALLHGLSLARWNARFEVINKDPLVIFDGAHNPQGILSATESISHYFNGYKVIVLSGVLADKDYRYIASKLSEISDRAFTITPDNPRALSAEDYAKVLCENGMNATATDGISSAIKMAVEEAGKTERPLVCLGSLYTYADVVAALRSL